MVTKFHCNIIPSKSAAQIGTLNFDLAPVISRQMDSLTLALYILKRVEDLRPATCNCRMNNARENSRDWNTMNEAGMIRRLMRQRNVLHLNCCLILSLRDLFCCCREPNITSV